MKHFGNRALALICAAALSVAALSPAAMAQDFYGEGNVLIAVDMGPYAENDAVAYPEGTMGSLVWGDDAPEGTSTRPAFSPRAYTVPEEVAPLPLPDYAIEICYTVGQKTFLPYDYVTDPEIAGTGFFAREDLPPEVFDESGAPAFLYNRSATRTIDGETYYYLTYKLVDDVIYPCTDFLEIECVAVTEYSTVWQYTGVAYSTRPGFDASEYVGAIDLSDAELQHILDTCDEAYTRESAIYGDPRREDVNADRDGKVAYVVIDLTVVMPQIIGLYDPEYTSQAGFDCLILSAEFLPERRTGVSQKYAEDSFTSGMIHELNHLIIMSGIGWDNAWSIWLTEAFADSAIFVLDPDNTEYLIYQTVMRDGSSHLRMIPGMLWSYEAFKGGYDFVKMYYTLGPFFLSYVERETTGQADGRLWTEYFAQQIPGGSNTGESLDIYLRQATGEGLDEWMAQFMAAVIVGADDGLYCMANADVTAAYRFDPALFFRPWETYGTQLSFDAADEDWREFMRDSQSTTAIEGGGTAYAWRNDAGGKIAITGADDRWYFFALDLDLPPAPEPAQAEVLSTFDDLKPNAWYLEAVTWAIENGIMQGTGSGFAPKATASRAMFLTVLWRLAGEPEAEGDFSFSDVPEGAWYAEAVRWAAAEGILNGYGDGRFGAKDPITREQLVTLLWRICCEPEGNGDLTGYADEGKISNWAHDAVAWAVGAGLIQGKGGGVLDPKGETTRAEIAQLVMNLAKTNNETFLAKSAVNVVE